MPAAKIKAALAYAKAGYSVVVLHGVNPKTRACTCREGVKCKTPGKHPRFKDWTATATTDEAVITRLFTKYPDANVGLSPPEGCIVVDVDPRNGGDATTLALPARTPTQMTGSGGMHYVVRVDDMAHLPNLKKQGIDFLKPGRHQFVAWPSMHASGNQYMWQLGLGFDVKPSRWIVPTKFQPATQAPPPGEFSPINVEEQLEAPLDTVREWLAVTPADEYSDWVNVGQALKHAYGDEAFDLWDEWSQKSDKYDGAAMRSKWDSFNRNAQTGDRALRTLRTIRYMAQQNGWRYAPPELDFQSDLFRKGLVRDLVTTPAPPIEWVIGNVLPRGKVCMLAGPGGVGKSFLILVLAAQHSTGLSLLGAESFAPTRPASHSKVIYFTAEDDREDIHRRLESVFMAYMLPDEQRAMVGENFSVQCTRGKDWRLVEEVGGVYQASRAAELIIQNLKRELGISLIVFDPSIMFAGIDENDNAQASAYMRVLDRIASQTGASVLIGTHSAKSFMNAEHINQGGVRGASAFVDNARGAWMLRTMTEDEAGKRMVAPEERHRFARLVVVKNNYGPTGTEVWLERVQGGALRLAQLPTLAGLAPIAGGAVLPVPQTPGERKRSSAKAAALQAHALQLLKYIHEHDDGVTGMQASIRTMGRDVWGADASLTSEGMNARTKRVLDYCEAGGLVQVIRPSEGERAAHQPSTYVLTDDGRKAIE
jgi:KaiC/GvpD/RAD55 family RecA-like ATPase